MGSLLKKARREARPKELADIKYVYIDGKKTKVADWLYRLATKLPPCLKKGSQRPIDHFAMLLQAFEQKGENGVNEYFNVIMDVTNEAFAIKQAAKAMGLVDNVPLKDVLKYGKSQK